MDFRSKRFQSLMGVDRILLWPTRGRTRFVALPRKYVYDYTPGVGPTDAFVQKDDIMGWDFCSVRVGEML